jgi:hypothetical protein
MTIIELYPPRKKAAFARLHGSTQWSHQPSAISHQPSAISHQLSAISYELIGRQPRIHWRSQRQG